MTDSTNFQGVVCCCLDRNTTVQESLLKLLDLKTTSKFRDVQCANLELKNKYYQATIQLFDVDLVPKQEQQDILEHSYSIIIYADGQTLSSELLDSRLKEFEKVQGEPRILVCHGIDEECAAYKTLRDWSIQNGFDLILTSEPDFKVQMIDSLSAYRWQHRSEPKASGSESVVGHGPTGGDRRELDDDLLKKLTDFDTLLNKLGAYRDRPELRGDPNDKNIEEIAEILTGLLGDDVDNFLDSEELRETTNGQQNHQT